MVGVCNVCCSVLLASATTTSGQAHTARCCISIRLAPCLPMRPSLRTPLSLNIFLSGCVPAWCVTLFVRLSGSASLCQFCLSVRLPACLVVCRSLALALSRICASVLLSVCLCVCLSLGFMDRNGLRSLDVRQSPAEYICYGWPSCLSSPCAPCRTRAYGTSPR